MPKDDKEASEAARDSAPAADQSGSPYDGGQIEAAVSDPLRGANEKAVRVPDLINMIRKID